MNLGDAKKAWTDAEDAKLIDLRARKVCWLDIPAHMPGRTIVACQQHLHNLKLKAQGKKKDSGYTFRKRKAEKAKSAASHRREQIAAQSLAYIAAQRASGAHS